MESQELIQYMIEKYELVIYVLAGVITVLAGVIAYMYLRNEKQKKEDRVRFENQVKDDKQREHEDREKFMELMKSDIEAKMDVKRAIENNNALIKTHIDTIYRIFPQKRTGNG